MADQTNPTSGNPIDLRTMTGGSPPASGTSSSSSATSASAQDQESKFEISDTVKNQYPDLIPMIIETESMTDDERQYWFQILPIMTDEQVVKLREILQNEKKQLQKLDAQYDDELARINKKHVSEWKAYEAKEKREKLHATEKIAESQEQQTEEELLKKLQQL